MNTSQTVYPKYDSYKDSGVEWIGHIPEEWNVAPLRAILSERKEKNLPIKTENILSLSMHTGVIPYEDKKAGGNKAKSDLTAYNLAYPGDIIMNSMNVIAGSVGLSEYFGAISPVYYAFYKRGETVDIGFTNAIFQSEAFQKSLLGLGNGILVKTSTESGKMNTIRMRIPGHKLKNLLLPHPKYEVQKKINFFLEKECFATDQVISKKKKLIELLQEKSQALITQAVTKGLDPNVKMKDSGVKWIGEIPENWQVIRGKFIFTRVVRPVQDEDETITCFRDGEVTKRSNRRMDGFTESLQEIGYQGIRQGDLVIHTMDAFAGAVGVSDSDGKGSPVLSVCQAINGDSVKYYAYLIRHMAESLWIEALAKGIRQRSTDFRYETFVQQYLPRPSASEQKTIATKLEDYCNKTKHLINKIESQIEVLQEFKKTLIYNAVTGKIKV